MVKKWTIAGLIYLAAVIAGYGIYDMTVEPAAHQQQEENLEHNGK